ncbi:hypothetical protein AUEXF2481DRAFT_41290 [Aureobasidium subglaciale EXF-2481]|uniref:Uncharacterized protein n=1 Tax=Aureobasidium subglaciale (strain EXF-2481) TaxID=1043005 RepID=A0A074YDH1_AURSE|nr:uncharacterized protein AUEXF2481DRAFT_41290 [Aureobasidium subglaciale EXF-2481]KEQ94099.1 hypothetical protein AUEXF2481DRAFT_41290 [Aureobasidium subglaciale EXF-2481]
MQCRHRSEKESRPSVKLSLEAPESSPTHPPKDARNSPKPHHGTSSTISSTKLCPLEQKKGLAGNRTRDHSQLA